MLNWIKKLFVGKSQKNNIQLSEEFLDIGGLYIQLVKSRIIESLVTDYLQILSKDASHDHRFALMLALCAYFAARTDYELEKRSVTQSVRDEVWPHVFEAVLVEMDITGKLAEFSRIFILKQMDLVRGVIKTKGVDNTEAVITTLEILSQTAAKLANDKSPIHLDHSRILLLLDKYSGYSSYLDNMASEACVQA